MREYDQAGQRGKSGEAELARLHSLNNEKAKESSLWLRVLPTSDYLRLTDSQWRWAAQLRLGMPPPVYEPHEHSEHACAHPAAANSNGWHPLTCITERGIDITARHNAVLQRLVHFARMRCLRPIVEPAGLHSDDNRRPDIQLDLPDVTLLGDVTISHPLARSWQKIASSRGVEAVGDAREVEKNDLYADMAQQCEMEFGALVLYTYGGFHSSALKFISQMARAIDPATCLTSPSQWKQELMEQIAIAVQRGNANIMIRAARQQRGRPWSRRRRPNTVTSLSSRPHGQCAAEGEGRQLWSRRAMTYVARLIGFPTVESDCRDRRGSAIDSDAETAVEDWEESPSTPSAILETPPRDQGGQQTEERMNVEQRQAAGEGAANVCEDAVAVRGDRDHAVHRCTEVQAMAGVAAAMVTGAGMLLGESEEVQCGEVECDRLDVGDGMVMDECKEVLCEEGELECAGMEVGVVE